MRLRFVLAATLLTFAPPVAAQDEEPVTVLVLGTYHFTASTSDVNAIEPDDVLGERRQAELNAVAEALSAFRPTVIATELTALPPYDDQHWAEYHAGGRRSVRNEREQIAYRLAEIASVERVYAIDEQPEGREPDYFPYDHLTAFAERTGSEEALARMFGIEPFLQRFETVQREGSVADVLILMNDGSLPDDGYWSALTFGEGEDQPGPELAAGYFLRNAKIFNKLVQVTEPGDRVVVVYGAGHGPWLREMIERTPGFVLEPVLPYLERAADN